MTDLDRRMLLGVAGVAGIAAVARAAQAGSLNPPAGPVSPTMKALDQVEPRTPLQSLSGDASNQFVINQPGSYYLIDNINGVSGLDGIRVNAAHVTIDLNGFAMLGTTGSGNAIFGSSGANGLCVRNGAISGWAMGINMVNTTTQGRFEFLNVDHCTNGGIFANGRCLVSYCCVHVCGGFGIAALNGARIVGCIAAGTTAGGHGIAADYASMIQDCNSSENTGCGFVTQGSGVMIVGCKATFNSLDGVLVNGPYGEIVDTLATHNNQCGIHSTTSNGRIDRCSALQNVQNGIQVDTVNGATLILRCTSSSNLGTDYAIAGGNRPAQVASWGSVAGGFGATDAVANVR